jgi:L-iditol 2-dehydrogenase
LQMKSCQLVGGSLRLIETEVPEIGRGDVLVNMKACGICGTDVEKVLGHYASNVLGHEAVGILEKVGRDVDGFSEGDRVFPHHHVPCYTCHYCRNGSETMCPHFSASNLIPGGLSEYFILPEWNVSHGGLFRIPSSIDFRRGTLIEPMACVLRAIGKVKQNVDLTWLVVGAGPVGMLHVLALHLLEKGNVVCVEPDEERRRFSKRNQKPQVKL